jgi:multidrug transporter EmrE-like cation transporter
MSQRLPLTYVAILCLYALAMAGGQMLFKSAALATPQRGALAEWTLELLRNWQFFAALVTYFLLAVLWVWILRVVPLSQAYPFVALAFAIAPLMGGIWFGEPLSARLLVGLAIIMCGLLLVAA